MICTRQLRFDRVFDIFLLMYFSCIWLQNAARILNRFKPSGVTYLYYFANLTIMMLTRTIFKNKILYLGIYAALLEICFCRKYTFPMCPPAKWKIPGGEVTAEGQVEYELMCDFGYTQPMLANRSRKFICNSKRQDPLPRRCIKEIYANVKLKFAVSVTHPVNRGNPCNSLHLAKQINTHRMTGVYTLGPNNILRPDEIRMYLKGCQDISAQSSVAEIVMHNVQQGNSTTPKGLKDYYLFVISEAFLSVKQYFIKRGYAFTITENLVPKNDDAGSLVDVDTNPRPSNITSASQEPNSQSIRGRRSSNATTPDTHKMVPLDFFLDSFDPQEVSREDIDGGSVMLQAQSSEKKQNTYKGLYMLSEGPIGHSCPEHLVMRQDFTKKILLCVGCGPGWYLQIDGKDRTGNSKGVCYPCGPGFYNAEDTATTCIACPIKYVTAPWDASSEDDCFRIKVSDSDKRKWSLLGYIMPIAYLSVLFIMVAMVSKITIGASQYDKKTGKSIMKSTDAGGSN